MITSLLTVENQPVKVQISDLVEAYIDELNLTAEDIFISITNMEEPLLSMKSGERFTCIDMSKDVSIVCSVSEEDGEKLITVLVCTGLDNTFTV